MNKVTLSVAALAAIGGTVQVQAAEQTVKDQNAAIKAALSPIIEAAINDVDTNYPDVKVTYHEQLSELMNELVKAAESETKLIVESYYTNKVNEIKNAAKSAQEPYTLQKELLTDETSKDIYSIKELQSDFNTENAKVTEAAYPKAYKSISGKMKAQQTAIDILKAKIEGYDLSTRAIIAEKGELVKSIGTIKSSIEEIMKNAPLEEANLDKYTLIAERIKDVKEAYNAKLQDAISLLPSGDNGEYGDWQKMAINELNEQYRIIVAVEKKNGTAESHENAAANYADNDRDLTAAKAEIANILNKYTTNKATEEAAKKEADELYNDVNTQYTTLNNLLKKCEVATKWANQLNDISTALSTMQSNITLHYSNGHNDLSSHYDYAAAKTTIADKITKLTSDSNPDVLNWEAWKRVNEKIKTLRADKNKAVKTATDNVSTNKKYNAAAHMTKFAEAIEGKISALETLNNTAKAGGTAVDYEKNDYDESGVRTDITNYGTYAANALASYNTAQEKIKAANDALAKLKEAVGEEDELTTVGGAVGVKTYKSTITGIEKEIKAIENKVEEANGTDEKTGVSHKTKMSEAAALKVYNESTADEIKSAIEVLAKQYETDKKQFEKNNKVAAANKIVADANTLKKELTDKLNVAVYGENKEFTKADLGNKENALVGTQGTITKLIDQIAAATTKDGKDLIPSDWDTKSDDDKYKAAEDVITSLTQVIATLNDLTDDVEAAAQDAADARDNYARFKVTYPKTDLNTSEIATLISSTRGKVAGYKTKYYTTLLSDYATELDGLKKDVEKAYAEFKMAELQEALEISIAELKDKVDAVEAAAKANEDAHNAQVAKTTGKDGLQDVWNAAYKYISENDESTQAKDYLAELGPLQEAINKLNTTIQNSYDNGKSVEDGKATIDAEIERITTSIADISARQKAGYVAAIQKDNDDQHKLFTDAVNNSGAYEDAVNSYNDAVDALTQFSKIKNQALQEAIKDENLVKTHDEIYDYANKLRDLFSRESKKYTSTVSPDLYSSEEFRNEANTFKSEINGKLASYQKTVNDEALKLYKANIQDAVNALDAAKKVVEAWDNYKKDPASAFADIAEDINAASKAANLDGTGSVDPMFAVMIDEWIDLLDADNLSKKIEADKLAAAKDEFSKQYNKVVTLYDSEVATIKTYTSIDTSTYLADLKTKKEAVDKANEDWAKVADKVAKCTSYVNTVKAYYDVRVGDAFDNEHSMEYNDATAASVASEANIAAHNDMLGKMAKAKISINEVLEYIDVLFVTHKKGSAVEQEIDRIVDEYEDMLDQIESWYQAGECADNLEFSFRNYVNPKLPGSLPQALDLLKTNAITNEIPALKTEIDRVKEEYNKAVEKNGLQDEEIAKKEAAIADLYKKLVGPDAEDATDAEKCIKNRWNEEILSADDAIEELVALHSEIAALSKSLTDTYDANAYAAAVKEVKAKSDALNAVVADLETRAAKFEAVNKEFGDEITEAKNTLAGIDFDFEKMNADSQILFYKNNLINDYDRLNNDINSWKSDFNKMHAKYDVNKKVYESLSADLENYKAELERVNAEVADFKNTVTEDGTIDGKFGTYNSRDLHNANITTAIADAIAELETAYSDVTLLESDKGKYSQISKDIVAYERKAKYDEVNSYDIKLLAKAISNVEEYRDEQDPLTGKPVNNFSNATANYLKDTIASLEKQKDYANNYNNNSFKYYGIKEDLYGKVVATWDDENSKWILKPCDYLSEEGWTAVRERVQSLITQANDLLKDAKEKAYTQGDADHNRKVNVNDYSVVRNWILLAKNFEDIEEAKAYGGDVNGDKKFDVADLTCISNIIFDIDYELPELAKSPARAKVVDIENSLTVASESEETTIFGKTVRLAVNINNVPAFTAGQMDITLPQGMKLAGQSLSDRANGHELLANEISDGKYRLVASTVENNEFYGNGGALIYLDVEVGSDFAGGSISVDNAIFSDAKANSYYLTANGPIVPTGIDGIEAATVKERIYSVGGQMMKAVKKGLNIIVGDDNKAKKVVK